MQSILKDKRNLWYFCGMLVAIVAIIIGLVFLFCFKDSGGVSYARFGADFYTEIYSATAFAGNRLKDIYEMMSACFGVFLIFSGAITLCVLGSKICYPVKQENTQEIAQGEETDPVTKNVVPEDDTESNLNT